MNEFIAHFHFLRPLVLAGLLVIPLLFWWQQRRHARSDWRHVVDAHLLAHLQSNPSPNGRSASSNIFLAVGLALLIIAAAGPAWQKIDQPIAQTNDQMVVVLDLSLSMLAQDEKPDRLTRAKQKLRDLLQTRQQGETALIAFSGDAYVVTPLTDDTRTIINSLPALDPFLVPVVGSRVDLAMAQAVDLLNQAGATNGRILFVGDDIPSAQVNTIRRELGQYKLDVLAVGTASGSPIPLPERGYLRDDDGAVVIPQVDFAALASIATQHNGQAVSLTLNDSDLEQLDVSGAQFRLDLQAEKREARSGQFDDWEDSGYLFLFAALPFLLGVFRQGALSVVAIALVTFLPADNSWAESGLSPWLTADQQAQRALEQGDAERAAQLFQSPVHRAQALYEAGQYETAAETFAEVEGARYNQANALARAMKLEEALALYEQVLSENPEHADARHNRDLVQQLLAQQNQNNETQSQNDQQNSAQNENDASNSSQNSNANERNNSSDSSENSENNQGQNGQSGDRDSSAQSEQNTDNQHDDMTRDESDDRSQSAPENAQDPSSLDDESEREDSAMQTQTRAQENAGAEDSDSDTSSGGVLDELSAEEQQSYEQWMRRVPDDPAGLLRRKFEHQSRQRARTDEGGPLW